MLPCEVLADGRVVASRGLLATGTADRARGLLGRSFGSDLEAIVLTPCRSVHTVGMRYPIDVVFYDARCRVARVVEELVPFRVAWCAAARGAVELPGGSARGRGIRPGQAIEVRSRGAGTDGRVPRSADPHAS